MKVLSIDPGNQRMGLASLNQDKDGVIHLGPCSLILNPKDESIPFNKYLNRGIAQICELFPLMLHKVQPDFITSETVPVGRLGSNTELVVASITVCKVIAWQWGVDWYDIDANTVKKQVTDDGRATKSKVKHAVIKQFPSVLKQNDEYKEQQKKEGLKPEGFPQDLYDAIAIGWAGLIKYGNQEQKED